ncbi:class I adenylate-forming enzyme family protein [Aliiroseovarius subalbicans]|uniref:class I adenylate-forming enzyme family protein n=1 Tax=Aliiroseovarius subalbicans TaxID=2925840 RepID=UPI001F5986E8|nr:class I adenylate-forming enzyme family protein [Aliiroseovarius subalbicans]MCI2398438.1 acyl--CoA ligase [Aliiroseovarius subalbicans]
MLSVFDQGAFAPPPDRFNMAAHVLTHADDMGDKIALSILGGGGEDWSFTRLACAVRGIAGGLLARGFVPGDRVLMRLGNNVDFPLAFLGSIAAGLVPVPTSSQLTEAEITRMTAIIAPALIIGGVGIALPAPLPCDVLTSGALHGMADHPPAPYAMGDPDRPAYVIFTSGTSGNPRAVTHAHRAIWARQMMHQGWYGLTQSDRLMHAGAFNWTYTLGTGLMDPWSVGATALIPAPGTPPPALPGLIADHKATIFAAAPGVFRQMMKAALPDFPTLRHALSAGEKLPAATRAHWEQATGTPVHEAFGMSECSTFVSGAPDHPAPAGTLGYPQPGRRVAVLGDDGPVDIGEPGTLAVSQRDPGLMLGYHGAEAETRARFRGEWFLTGDSVSMGDDGAITYLGRGDDMMNAGGFRVSPIEVEAAMTHHPGVLEAACAEVQVKADASVIACFYVPEQAPVDAAALTTHAHATLAHYKCPRLFVPVDALPRGANNKLLRRALRDQYEAALSPAANPG